MYADDDLMFDDSNETSGDDVDFEPNTVESSPSLQIFEEYYYEVLSTEEIVQHMTNCINDVNNVLQIPSTITRILLNYFHWDKEKLMERFFDGNQDELFEDARVINPFKKLSILKPKFTKRILGSEECEICFIVSKTQSKEIFLLYN